MSTNTLQKTNIKVYIIDKNKNIKNHNVNHKKPTPSTYLLQSLRGQLFGIHFLIIFLKLLWDWAFFNSIGTISHIFGPRYKIVSMPW